MDIQLQELIGKIKKDGIESAAEEAGRIKAQAQDEAAKIVDAAKREAEAIVNAGKADAERFEKAGIAAVEQASRNTVLAFKGEIQALLDKLAADKTAAAYDEGVLKKAIPEVLKAWAAGKEGSLDVLLSEGDAKALEGYFKGELSSALKGGVEFRLSRAVSRGFRIGEKDGSAYYDFSAEAVSDYFSAYLNPRLAGILKDAVKGQ